MRQVYKNIGDKHGETLQEGITAGLERAIEVADYRDTLAPVAPANERIWCRNCGKSVSSPVPKDTIVRAYVECPECIEKRGALAPVATGQHSIASMLDELIHLAIAIEGEYDRAAQPSEKDISGAIAIAEAVAYRRGREAAQPAGTPEQPTPTQAEWVTYASKVMEKQYQFYGTNWLMITRSLWPWIAKRLPAAPPAQEPPREREAGKG